jgi:hypothetical protein
MTVPKDVTITVVEDELPAAEAYARRHGLSLTWLKDELILLVNGKHPADGGSIRWKADLSGYRAVPPIWLCFKQDANGDYKPCIPKGGTLPGGVGSMFHNPATICAPFNRLAYKEHSASGPHGDWGGPANWLKVRGTVSATTLAGMLAQITAHLKYSPGWQ